MAEATATLLKGAPLAKAIKAQVAEAIAAAGGKPCLLNVMVGESESSLWYLGQLDKQAAKLGIESRRTTLPADATSDDVCAAVAAAAEDPSVHGLMIQFPLPKHVDREAVCALVPRAKDVDGVTEASLGAVMAGVRRHTAPATACAVVELLAAVPDLDMSGKEVTVIGRSLVVGRPVAAMLSVKGETGNATVTLCHTRTADVAAHGRAADVLVAAAGVRAFVTSDMVKPGAVVIDVGTHVVETADGKSTLAGDVDPSVAEIASVFTPVPGGVGPVTNAVLMRHVAAAALPDAFPPAW